eukprot:superscaffoldBa00001381_g10305
MTNYNKSPSPTPDTDPDFYGRFEQSPAPPYSPPTPLPPPPFFIQEEEARATFRKTNKRKVAGPERISSAVLNHCAAQLAPTFTNILNISLCQCTVPQCFKDSIIIPVPKSNKISCLNNFRPIALTSSWS